MIIARNLINDDVIIAKITELQVQFLDALTQTHAVSTDFLIENNKKELADAETEERADVIRKNVEQIEKNQKNRIINISFYEKQIEFLKSVLAKNDGFIEIDERLKSL